ncbi:hypothetical protein B0H15DRAFT_948536 [Mycena belliarum]|uniref:Uncharacterized protein n=1 Tax=Mycena belliarum TaxID=1033014 RepID=A0AAD6U5F5_9AGAR|nr:hypothetical protein B0H15DRAFT_948536 [Mycena belliae]
MPLLKQARAAQATVGLTTGGATSTAPTLLYLLKCCSSDLDGAAEAELSKRIGRAILILLAIFTLARAAERYPIDPVVVPGFGMEEHLGCYPAATAGAHSLSSSNALPKPRAYSVRSGVSRLQDTLSGPAAQLVSYSVPRRLDERALESIDLSGLRSWE